MEAVSEYMDYIDDDKVIDKSYDELINEEIELGINSINFYTNFNKNAEKIKTEFQRFLLDCKEKIYLYVLMEQLRKVIHY